MSEEERIFHEHRLREQAFLEANARLVRERTDLSLRQAEDRERNGSVVFGLPSTLSAIVGSGSNRVPTEPRGYYVDDSRFQGHESSIYEPTISQRLWMEALARTRRPANMATSQQFSTSELGETFSIQDIRERRPRVYGSRW